MTTRRQAAAILFVAITGLAQAPVVSPWAQAQQPLAGDDGQLAQVLQAIEREAGGNGERVARGHEASSSEAP